MNTQVWLTFPSKPIYPFYALLSAFLSIMFDKWHELGMSNVTEVEDLS